MYAREMKQIWQKLYHFGTKTTACNQKMNKKNAVFAIFICLLQMKTVPLHEIFP